MTPIKSIHAMEILDSRGRPTIQCKLQLESGAQGVVSVPSGASTGSAEALELRDGDPNRYRGLGCRKAVWNVNQSIAQALQSRTFQSQSELDEMLIYVDGTANKSKLGANAILSVSLAYAKALAQEQNIPLYQYFATLINNDLLHLPRPMINLFSGGKHAGGQIEIQDIQVLPTVATSIDQLLQITFDVYYTAADLVTQQYDARPLTADEGGLAPPFADVESMFQLAIQAIEKAGYRPRQDVVLTVDVAATHFFDQGTYNLGDNRLTADGMIQQILSWVDKYAIYSVEDGLAEDDWEAWQHLLQQIPPATLVLGDDLLCTNVQRIQRAIQQQASNALLLKVNQIGTLTESASSNNLARSANWKVVISARSGETEDNWLADLAVGWSADFIKVGSITQSERLAKYNRLLAIEQENPDLKMRPIR